jgi:hypothetical protein
MPPDLTESPFEAREISTLSQESLNQKIAEKDVGVNLTAKDLQKEDLTDEEVSNPDAIIRSGADAALYLLPLRDDFDSSLTFRSVLIASALACFQAVMNQIYQVRLQSLHRTAASNFEPRSTNRPPLTSKELSSC